jgi:hypothetical protein
MTAALGIIFLLPTIIILVFSSKYLSQNAGRTTNAFGR